MNNREAKKLQRAIRRCKDCRMILMDVHLDGMGKTEQIIPCPKHLAEMEAAITPDAAGNYGLMVERDREPDE